MAETENNCPVCKTGEHPQWAMGRGYCDKHNVCVKCGIKRSDLKDVPWGVSIGAFKCKPCEKQEREARIESRKAQGFEHEYTNEVVCPHCGFEHSDSWEMTDGDYSCDECHGDFVLERIVTVDYTTTKKEPRNDQ